MEHAISTREPERTCCARTKTEDDFPVRYEQGKYFKIKVNPKIEIEFRRNGAKYICPNKVFMQLAGFENSSVEKRDQPTEVDVNHADVRENHPTGGPTIQSLRPYSRSVFRNSKITEESRISRFIV